MPGAQPLLAALGTEQVLGKGGDSRSAAPAQETPGWIRIENPTTRALPRGNHCKRKVILNPERPLGHAGKSRSTKTAWLQRRQDGRKHNRRQPQARQVQRGRAEHNFCWCLKSVAPNAKGRKVQIKVKGTCVAVGW